MLFFGDMPRQGASKAMTDTSRMLKLEALAEAWKAAKASENEFTEKRRSIEDEIIAVMGFPETTEGTRRAGDLKVTYKLNKKVDIDELNRIVTENDLPREVYTSCFRWSAEVSKRGFASTHESITSKLEGAIVTKPARPSVTIDSKEEE